jgi:hypothetical protein
MEPAILQSNLYCSHPRPDGSRSIRVLDLAPSSQTQTTNTDELHGSIRVISLSESPSFNALSYVWGSNTSRKHTLSLGSHKIEITQNCHDALQALRSGHGNLTIWVDAICINQSDISEKTQPILLMEENTPVPKLFIFGLEVEQSVQMLQ